MRLLSINISHYQKIHKFKYLRVPQLPLGVVFYKMRLLHDSRSMKGTDRLSCNNHCIQTSDILPWPWVRIVIELPEILWNSMWKWVDNVRMTIQDMIEGPAGLAWVYSMRYCMCTYVIFLILFDSTRFLLSSSKSWQRCSLPSVCNYHATRTVLPFSLPYLEVFCLPLWPLLL